MLCVLIFEFVEELCDVLGHLFLFSTVPPVNLLQIDAVLFSYFFLNLLPLCRWREPANLLLYLLLDAFLQLVKLLLLAKLTPKLLEPNLPDVDDLLGQDKFFNLEHLFAETRSLLLLSWDS